MQGRSRVGSNDSITECCRVNKFSCCATHLYATRYRSGIWPRRKSVSYACRSWLGHLHYYSGRASCSA